MNKVYIGMMLSTVFLLSVLGIAGCHGMTTQTQFKKYFDLTVPKDLTREAARRTLLQKFPVGTPRLYILRFFQQSSFGDLMKQKSDSWTEMKDEVFCRITVDSNSVWVGREWGILFLIDKNGALRDIQIEDFLTGP